ncbi:unnamed protein product, partial [Ectocarpus fasciculatus]
MLAANRQTSYSSVQATTTTTSGRVTGARSGGAKQQQPAPFSGDSCTFLLGVGMGSSEGGRSAAAVSAADRIRRWRVPEFVGVVVGLAIVALVQACFSEYEQFVPENNKEGINGFPVGLGAEWCTASDLSSCAIQSESGCCKEMKAGKAPHQTVDEVQLWFVYFAIPAAFVAVRQVLTKLGLYRGAASLADVILGLVFCLGFSVTLTDAIKFMVGRPRPNYAALRALVEYGGSNMLSFK